MRVDVFGKGFPSTPNEAARPNNNNSEVNKGGDVLLPPGQFIPVQ